MSESQFDVAIIGGGISGIGVAFAAIDRGLKVVIYEKNKLAQATSNNSLRIIHGGFRYLQNLSISRVVQSLKDQNFLLEKYPHLIKPLPCIMPLNDFGLKSPIPARMGTFIYRLIKKVCGANNLASPIVLHRSDLPQEIPIVKTLKNQYFLHWYDAVIRDIDSFHQELTEELKERGVTIKENSYINDLSKVCAKKVIDTRGPWLDFNSKNKHLVKAFNLVINTSIEKDYAIGIQSKNGNLYFLVPRDGATVFGTFYKNFSGNLEDLTLSEEEVTHAVKDLNNTVPNLNLKTSNILKKDIGILTAESIVDEKPKLYGQEEVFVENGIVKVLSTKYTTFLSQGRKAIKYIDNSHDSNKL